MTVVLEISFRMSETYRNVLSIFLERMYHEYLALASREVQQHRLADQIARVESSKFQLGRIRTDTIT